jgi:hypothetical protein
VCDLRVCDILVFEEHCVTDSCCPGFHNVDVETLVMLQCRPNVKTGVRVNIPGLSVLRFDMGHYCASQGCKWAFHVIVLPMDMGIHGHWQFWGTSSWVIPFFVMHALNSAEHSLSKQWCFNPSAESIILLTIFW